MNLYGKFLNNWVFDLDYMVMCLVENASLYLRLQTYNNGPKVDLGIVCTYPPNSFFKFRVNTVLWQTFYSPICRQQ